MKRGGRKHSQTEGKARPAARQAVSPQCNPSTPLLSWLGWSGCCILNISHERLPRVKQTKSFAPDSEGVPKQRLKPQRQRRATVRKDGNAPGAGREGRASGQPAPSTARPAAGLPAGRREGGGAGSGSPRSASQGRAASRAAPCGRRPLPPRGAQGNAAPAIALLRPRRGGTRSVPATAEPRPPQPPASRGAHGPGVWGPEPAARERPENRAGGGGATPGRTSQTAPPLRPFPHRFSLPPPGGTRLRAARLAPSPPLQPLTSRQPPPHLSAPLAPSRLTSPQGAAGRHSAREAVAAASSSFPSSSSSRGPLSPEALPAAPGPGKRRRRRSGRRRPGPARPVPSAPPPRGAAPRARPRSLLPGLPRRRRARAPLPRPGCACAAAPLPIRVPPCGVAGR